MARRDDVMIENAEIRARNFVGKEGQFNAKGERNFLLLLDEDLAAKLSADGWNVKVFEAREEGDVPQPFIKVKVNFNGDNPPRCYLVTARGKTLLGAEDLAVLDYSQIVKADIILNPYRWEFNGKTGTTAYLVKGYFTIFEDEIDLKYADVADSAQSSVSFPDED